MVKTGRNDPCPCGSGKKYKNCCLAKERAARIRASAWRQDEQATAERLISFAQQPNFNPQIIVAFNLFWNGNYGLEGANALDRDEMSRFLEWYVYDYRLEQSGKRVIDLFLEQTGPTLRPAERERVHAWQGSYLSLYRIASSADEGLLSVVDVFQDGEETIWDNGFGRLGLPGDLVLGRILRSSQPAHFSWAAILLSAALEGGLASFGKKAYEEYRQTHVQASWPEFLSNAGYILNHYLLRFGAEEEESQRPPGAYYDAFRAVERLREAERRLRERAARQTERLRREEQRQEGEKEQPLRQTQGGILLPGHVQYKGSRELER